MARKKKQISHAAQVLKEILEEDLELAELVRERVDRGRLSRYCRGLRRPSAPTLALLHELTHGRVAASDWGQP